MKSFPASRREFFQFAAAGIGTTLVSGCNNGVDWAAFFQKRFQEMSPEEIVKVLARLEKTGAKLIWATTTPVCPEPERNDLVVIDSKTEKAYRKAALKLMRKHKIQVNDLYKSIKPKQKEYAIGGNDVHFTSEGSQFLAEQVAEEIRKKLK